MPQKKFHDVFIVVEINKPTNIVDIPAPLQQQHSKEIDGSLQDRDSLLCRIQHPIWSPKLLLRSFAMQPPEDVSAPPEIEPSSIQVLWWPQTMSSNFGIAPENFSDLFLKNICIISKSNFVGDGDLRLLQSRSVCGSFYVTHADTKTLKLIEEKQSNTYQVNC